MARPFRLNGAEARMLKLHEMPPQHAKTIRNRIERSVMQDYKERDCSKATRSQRVKAAAVTYMNNFHCHLPDGFYRSPQSGRIDDSTKELHAVVDRVIKETGFDVDEYEKSKSAHPGVEEVRDAIMRWRGEGRSKEQIDERLISEGLLAPPGKIDPHTIACFRLWHLFVPMLHHVDDPYRLIG